MATSAPAHKPAFRSQLGETVRLARVRRRMSQTDLAEAAGVGPKQVHKLERGGDVMLSRVERVIAVLELSVSVSETAA